jgi:hypothetical protein
MAPLSTVQVRVEATPWRFESSHPQQHKALQGDRHRSRDRPARSHFHGVKEPPADQTRALRRFSGLGDDGVKRRVDVLQGRAIRLLA